MLIGNNLYGKLIISLVVVTKIYSLSSGNILDVDQGLVSVVVRMNSKGGNI